MPERIAKALSRAGVASRRDAERMVAAGRVSVNGRVIDSPATLVGPSDRIAVDGAPLDPPEAPRVWLFHKPAGVVTTARDEKGRQTVFDILPPGLPRVMTVGRLDLTSEGLLILTNDGELKRRMELPETGWTRKYRVRVNGRPDEAQLAPLRAGITLDGERFQPMAVTIDRQQGANAWLTVAIREGRNREIRRAMEAVGLTVNRLIRTGYGPFRLGALPPGAVEEVRPRVVRDQLGLAQTPARPDGPSGSTAARPAAGAGRRKATAARPAGSAAAGPGAHPPRPRRTAAAAAGAAAAGAPAGGKPGRRPATGAAAPGADPRPGRPRRALAASMAQPAGGAPRRTAGAEARPGEPAGDKAGGTARTRKASAAGGGRAATPAAAARRGKPPGPAAGAEPVMSGPAKPPAKPRRAGAPATGAAGGPPAKGSARPGDGDGRGGPRPPGRPRKPR